MIGLLNVADSKIYNSMGFGALCNHTINMCMIHKDLHKNTKINIIDPQLQELFEFVAFQDPEEQTYDILQYHYANENLFNNPSNAHRIAIPEIINSKNVLFNDLFKIKELEVYDKIADEYMSDNTLAIQLRGTDKYTDKVTPVDPNKIIAHISMMLDENTNINKIFLATDDVIYRNLLKNNFGDKLTYITENKVSTDGQPIHFGHDRSIMNKQAFTEAYVLSKSKYFLYSFSNISYLALTMGINNFKKIKNLNFQ